MQLSTGTSPSSQGLLFPHSGSYTQQSISHTNACVHAWSSKTHLVQHQTLRTDTLVTSTLMSAYVFLACHRAKQYKTPTMHSAMHHNCTCHCLTLTKPSHHPAITTAINHSHAPWRTLYVAPKTTASSIHTGYVSHTTTIKIDESPAIVVAGGGVYCSSNNIASSDIIS